MSENDQTLITEKSAVSQRWVERYRGLLNLQPTSDPEIVHRFQRFPVMHELDGLPTVEKIRRRCTCKRKTKQPGRISFLLSTHLRGGGEAMIRCLHSFALAAFNSSNLLKQLKDAHIISIYKKMGNRLIYGNSQDILLLSCGRKAIEKIELMRLIEAISETVLPESQCGFRRDRGTVDMVFVARLLPEKCVEHQNSYMVCVNLTKAFDTVNRELLWEVLERFGCPSRFSLVVESLHKGAMARVLRVSLRSDPLVVCSRVRQECVLVPDIFKLFLAVVMAAVRWDIDLDETSVHIRREFIQLAKTARANKCNKGLDNRVALYADDIAIVSCGAEAVSAQEHQRYRKSI